MRIPSVSPFTAPAIASGPSRVNSGGAPEAFATPQSSNVASNVTTSRAAAPQGQISVDMLMSIVGSEGDRELRKRMVENAEEGLQHLEALHSDMLSGKIDPERMNGLSSWLSDQSGEVDPQVASLMEDISLRAKVELAKHQSAFNQSNS